MPRNPGTGVYTLPSGTAGTPNTPIESAKYNTFTGDIAQDLNTARPVSSGGTGATNATDARTNLGLAIGTNVQAYDAGLASIAALTTAADKLPYTTASDTYAVTTFTAFARTLLDDGDATTALTTLGVSSYAKTLLDDTTAGAALTTLGVSSFVQTTLDDANAATFRTTIGANDASNLSSGTIADARLPTSMAGKTFSTDVTVGSGAGVVVTTDGHIEIIRVAGPFIDFKNNSGDDFDVRIIQDGSNSLDVQTTGATGLLKVDGDRVLVNDGSTNDISITGSAAQLGGVAAASYLQTANLGTSFAALTHNVIGSIAMLKRIGSGSFIQGDTSIGSQLEYCNADGSASGSNPSGTWTCLGRCTGATGGAASVAVWKRIA